MLIKLAVVKSKDCKVGEISLIKDIDESKSAIKKTYSKQYGQDLYDDDIVIESKKFELDKEMVSYMIKDPYGEENSSGIAVLPFAEEEYAQEFINFIKSIPNYNYCDLEKSINLVGGELISLPDAEVYW